MAHATPVSVRKAVDSFPSPWCRTSVQSGLDEAAARAFNAPVGAWPLLDEVINWATHADLIKMAPLIALLVALWFSRTADQTRRAQLLGGGLGIAVAMLVARVLQKTLPMRERPLHELPEIVLPPALDHSTLQGWSSFPSDHATLSFAISTLIFLQSRKLGMIALAWSMIVVIFPRLYFGFHYVSDVVAGAFLGAALVPLVTRLASPKLRSTVNAMEQSPQLSAPIGFLFLFTVATMFDDVRAFASLLLGQILR
jgi:undecaprenyl-diphosphatase